jgi:hypothetical protein
VVENRSIHCVVLPVWFDGPPKASCVYYFQVSCNTVCLKVWSALNGNATTCWPPELDASCSITFFLCIQRSRRSLLAQILVRVSYPPKAKLRSDILWSQTRRFLGWAIEQLNMLLISRTRCTLFPHMTFAHCVQKSRQNFLCNASFCQSWPALQDAYSWGPKHP